MSRRVRIFVTALSACVIFVPAIVIIQRWANSEATATLTKTTQTHPQTRPISTPLSLTTAYFSATLPGGFTIRSQTETATDPRVQLRLVASTDSYIDQQFAVTRGSMPSDGLRGIADYNLRATDTAIYTRFTPPNLPAGGQAFRNTQDPAAITLFWPRSGYYAELAFSTSGGASFDQLQATYRQMMQSWQWH
ncbi:MAG TPA: hypothetical protein VLG92_00490 [Candidatus Saccharimonadia bacterium]|nr:hypothetical protein [Candidatus Saccharimonadia bacterium]